MTVIPRNISWYFHCHEREQNSSGLWIIHIAQMFTECSHEWMCVNKIFRNTE